ncbi:MAG: hypothetical protein ACRESE_07710 [Gammaproteobacteria bacterium]
MVRLLGHRQAKATVTDKPNLLPPRHIPTLPGIAAFFITGSLYAVGFTYAFRWVGKKALSAIAWVAYVSVVVLAGFGVYVGWTSLRLLHS